MFFRSLLKILSNTERVTIIMIVEAHMSSSLGNYY